VLTCICTAYNKDGRAVEVCDTRQGRAVRREETSPDGGGADGNAAGVLVDALTAHVTSEALGAVPATQDPSSADAVVRSDLADGEDGAQTAVAPEPAPINRLLGWHE